MSGAEKPRFFIKGYKMYKHHLQDIIEPVVTELGYELVRVLLVGGQTNPTLQVMIDNLDQTDITIEDCTKVSHALSDMLDEKDPIENKYSLEVSSPGIDRPLTKLEHFKRYVGYDVRLETEEKVDDRKRFKGKISKIEKQNIFLAEDDKEFVIPFAVINKAKLVLTDDLWNEYQAAHEAVEN